MRQIRRSVEEKLHITDLLRELMRSLEKWVKSDLRAPMGLAVRFAFLVRTPFVSLS